MKDKKGAFARILNRIKPENKIFVDLNLEISRQVRHYLKSHGEIRTQKQLAERLQKEESEISRWLSGLHNLTLDSISKLTAAIGEDIILTDLQARAKYQQTIVVYVKESTYTTQGDFPSKFKMKVLPTEVEKPLTVNVNGEIGTFDTSLFSNSVGKC
jgi:transcriptional regulator with XRE-family HTH domain